MLGRSKEALWGGAAILAGSALFWLYQTRVIRRPKIVVRPAIPQIEPFVLRSDVATLGVYSPPKPTSAWTLPAGITPPTFPHESPVFGIDKERNTDDTHVDDYMNLPLESSGIPHTMKNQYVFLEESSELETPKLVRFTFFRLKVLKTREPTAPKTSIGGLRLLNGLDIVHHPEATVWNPYTGERKPYYPDSAWSDSDQREYIVRFPIAIPVNGYAILTSNDSVDYDPAVWSVEGSLNGVYWLPLDEQKSDLPLERGKWTVYHMKAIVGSN